MQNYGEDFTGYCLWSPYLWVPYRIHSIHLSDLSVCPFVCLQIYHNICTIFCIDSDDVFLLLLLFFVCCCFFSVKMYWYFFISPQKHMLWYLHSNEYPQHVFMEKNGNIYLRPLLSGDMISPNYSNRTGLSKLWRPRSAAVEQGIPSGSVLFSHQYFRCMTR